MKIAIDINELNLKQNTGVKVYTREIVNALGRIDKENEYILYANCPSKKEFNSEASELNSFLENKNFKLKITKSPFPFWTYAKLPQEIKKDKPDVLFMPIQAAPFFKKPKNIKIVIMVHDLAFLLFPEHFTVKDRFLLNFHTKRAIKMADKIIVPSEATKMDVIKFYRVDEDKIEVVYHGINSSKYQVVSSKQDLKKDVNILFVGTIQPRKNLIRLIEAFEMLNTKYQIPNTKLIIAGGKGWMADKIYERAKKSKLSDKIIFTGGVSDDELANLYKNAAVFVLPSLYEGFGLPILEAMSCGIPCVVSNNSSLSEIAGESALLVDACSSDDIAEKINILLDNEKLRNDLSIRGLENAKKFSWIKAGEKTLLVLSSKY